MSSLVSRCRARLHHTRGDVAALGLESFRVPAGVLCRPLDCVSNSSRKNRGDAEQETRCCYTTVRSTMYSTVWLFPCVSVFPRGRAMNARLDAAGVVLTTPGPALVSVCVLGDSGCWVLASDVSQRRAGGGGCHASRRGVGGLRQHDRAHSPGGQDGDGLVRAGAVIWYNMVQYGTIVVCWRSFVYPMSAWALVLARLSAFNTAGCSPPVRRMGVFDWFHAFPSRVVLG